MEVGVVPGGPKPALGMFFFQSVSFLKNIHILCINLRKMTAYIEYLVHEIFNNKYMWVRSKLVLDRK